MGVQFGSPEVGQLQSREPELGQELRCISSILRQLQLRQPQLGQQLRSVSPSWVSPSWVRNSFCVSISVASAKVDCDGSEAWRCVGGWRREESCESVDMTAESP
eukprot:1476349-Rhodomonas_salina.1